MKLKPIAEMVALELEKKFGIKANYEVEATKEWLTLTPCKDLYQDGWVIISEIYSNLIDNKWSLDERIEEFKDKLNKGNQRIDLFFHQPYNFIFEFDEKQHFNQFRLITLKTCSERDIALPNHSDYIEMSEQRIVNPGKSGFTKLKSSDPLFPPMYDGIKQDNRTRQRAFRDFLKDFIPYTFDWLNPTVRISYIVTGKKTNNFSELDVEKVKQYMDDFQVWDNIKFN